MNITFIDGDNVRINGTMVNVVEALGKAGACREEDPDLFFPENTDERTLFEATRQAKAICHACPMVDLCLEYALKNDTYGIWGATNEADRKQIRINRTNQVKATRAREVYAKRKTVLVGASNSERSRANLKKGNETLTKVNLARQEEAQAKVLAVLAKAMEDIQKTEKADTILTAKYRLDHPTLSLQELADAMGVSRGVAGGRIRRLMEKYDN